MQDYFYNDNTKIVVTLFQFTWKQYKFSFNPPLPFMAIKGATVKYVIADKEFDILVMADTMEKLEQGLRFKFCQLWEKLNFPGNKLSKKEEDMRKTLERTLTVIPIKDYDDIPPSSAYD
jgi:hypothetical protein